MLILLPPSESKTAPAAGDPLDLPALGLPRLTAERAHLVDALAAVSARDDALQVLGVGPSLAADVARNRELRTAPAAPALEVYTGVLYDALDADTLSTAGRAAADESLLVVSALWGAVRPVDRIPAYRLSMGSTLPGIGRLSTWWKPRLAPVLDELAAGQVVVDCRSAAYAAAWRAPAPRTVTVRVEQRRPDGSRSVVSHHAKHTRGLVARTLCELCGGGEDLTRVEQVGDALGEHWTVELTAPSARSAGVLTVVLDPQ